MLFQDAWKIYQKSAIKKSINRDKKLIDKWIKPIIGEIAALQWKDISLKNGTITILDPKNGLTRHANMTATLKALFDDMKPGKRGCVDNSV